MRVVVLGSGTLAQLRASILAADTRVEWLGIGSSRTDWAQQAASRTGASRSGTVDEMLAAAPDALVIASASARHAQQIRACLPMEVPLFCEKPIATSLEEAALVAEQAVGAGVPLQVGFQRRFDPGLRELRSSIASGALGTLFSITLTSHDAYPPSEAFAADSGGMFADLHVHDFDLARWLSGDEVEEVFTVAARRGPAEYLDALGDVDTSAIALRMRTGLPIVIRGARQDPAGYTMRSEVVTSKRSVVVGLERYADYRERFRDALVAETRAFLDLAAGQCANPCPGHECVEALRVAAAAELSHTERRTVSLSPS